MDIFSDSAFIIYLATFLTAIISGAIGMGGGIILLSVLANILPVNVVVPVHALLIVGTVVQRSFLSRKYINWRVAGLLSLGIVLGVMLGAQINVNIPENIFKMLLAVVLIVLVWSPSIKIPFKIPLVITGTLHGVISSVFGSGGIIQVFLARLKLGKHATVGTFGFTMAVLNIVKVLAFTVLGFSFSSYIGVILIAFIASLLGTYIGHRFLLARISEKAFKLLFKGLVSLFALRLFILNI